MIFKSCALLYSSDQMENEITYNFIVNKTKKNKKNKIHRPQLKLRLHAYCYYLLHKCIMYRLLRFVYTVQTLLIRIYHT